MKPIMLVGSFLMLTVAAWAAAPGMYPRGPKNLMSATYRPAVTTAAVPQVLGAKEAKRLAVTAESESEHTKLADFYRAQAEKLEARATAYDTAAADLRKAPVARTLAAPGTSARWEFAAKAFRKDSAANRNTATAQERMAIAASAGL
jgi:hypothetical protein